MDTRFSSLSDLILKRFDNDIKTKSILKLVQIMKLKENQEIKCHIPVSNPNEKKKLGVHGAE